MNAKSGLCASKSQEVTNISRTGLPFDPATTALLIIDMQVDYCSRSGALPRNNHWNTEPIEKIAPRLERMIDFSRQKGIRIIFIRMIEDRDFMLPNAERKIQSFKEPLSVCTPGSPGFEYYGVRPAPGDIEVIKNCYDAFLSPAAYTLLCAKGIQTPLLADVLKSAKIKTLLFTGVYSSRCVDSTLRGAFQQGYNCIVLRDLVAAPVELRLEHQAACGIWASIFAEVLNSNQIA